MTPEESAEQLSRTVNQLNEALNSMARAIDPSIKSIDSQSKAETENEKKKSAATKLGVEAASNLAKVFTSAAGAMYKGEKECQPLMAQ